MKYEVWVKRLEPENGCDWTQFWCTTGVPVEFFYLYNGDEKKEEGLKQ